jgi:hypothetical protein
MKLFTKKCAVAAALVAASACGAANAAAMDWQDDGTFAGILMTQGQTIAYNHTLDGFTPGLDSISSYYLTFNLWDDANDKPFELETALLSQPGAPIDSILFNLSGEEHGGWTAQGRWQLNTTGSLTVAVTSLIGDFYFGGSTLTAHGDKQSVPEPGTLALFGVALLGFGLMRHKRSAS